MVELDQGGRLAGRAGIVRTDGSLRSFAEHSFVLRRAEEETGSWRIVPDLSPHLLVHFERRGGGGHAPTSARIVGARTVYCDAPVGGRSFSVGVRLSPGMLPVLTGIPASELADRSTDLSDLWPGETKILKERVRAKPHPEAARHALLDFFHRLLDEDAGPDWRIPAALSSIGPSSPRVHRIARDLGIGRRTLRRVFSDAVGFSPRRALRIERLHRGMAEMGRRPGISHGRIAASAGFTDQPHMIREFRALVGETPVRWAERRFR